jgi:hypothetical protein
LNGLPTLAVHRRDATLVEIVGDHPGGLFLA